MDFCISFLLLLLLEHHDKNDKKEKFMLAHNPKKKVHKAREGKAAGSCNRKLG